MSVERIILLKGDITELDCDAIVNAANTELILGSGVAGAILKKGGKSIEDEAVLLGPVELGDAVITKGGALRAAHVIHAASMHPGKPATINSIAKATRNSLRIASEHNMKSIAFPALGTGVGGVSYAHCAREMLLQAVNFLDEHDYPKYIYFVLFNNDVLAAFKIVLEGLRE